MLKKIGVILLRHIPPICIMVLLLGILLRNVFPDIMIGYPLVMISIAVAMAIYYLARARIWLLKIRLHGTIKARGLIGQMLLGKRIVMLNGEMLNGRCSKAFLEIAYFNEQSAEPIQLYINSDGGNFDSMQLLANAIKTSKAPVDGIVIGRAFSAAAILLQHCRRRFALPYATLLFHECRMYGDSVSLKRKTQEDLRYIVDNLTALTRLCERNDSLCDAVVMDRSGIDQEQLQKICEETLSAEEALRLGLIDEIVTTL